MTTRNPDAVTVRSMIERAFSLGEGHAIKRQRADRCEDFTREEQLHREADKHIDSINNLLDEAEKIDISLSAQPAPTVPAAVDRSVIEQALVDGFALSDLDHFGVDIEARDYAIELMADQIMAAIALAQTGGNDDAAD